jgi:putative tricarboxylic transport membrane protein
MRAADKKALTEAIAAMVKTPSWQNTLAKFGWIDAYEPAEEFGALLKQQEELIGSSLKDLGLAG